MSIHTAGAELFRWFVFLMVCSLSWSLSYGPPVSVKVGSPALLTCSTPCLGDVKWALSKQLEQLPAASCKKEICVEGEAFKNRTKVKQENVSLLLDPAAYTDTGWYICYCSGSVLCDVHLEVFAPITMKASVGEMVTLPCYTRTDKNAAGNGIPIWWEKDGKPVVKLQYGKLSYGSGFEQRASVSASRYKDGDLSLDLTWFRSSDEGVYRCYHGNKDLGYPEAIILRESSTRLEQPVQPWWVSSQFWILFTLLALLCVAVFFWAWQRKRQQRQRTIANSNTPRAENRESLLGDSQSNNTGCVLHATIFPNPIQLIIDSD